MIFKVYLQDLCNILYLPGKTSNYNPEYHKIILFNKGVAINKVH